MTIELDLAEIKGVATHHYEQLQEFFKYQYECGEPQKQYVKFYDYDNFIGVDFEHLKTQECELPSSFLGSSIHPCSGIVNLAT